MLYLFFRQTCLLELFWEGGPEQVPLDLGKAHEALAPEEAHFLVFDEAMHALFGGRDQQSNGLFGLDRAWMPAVRVLVGKGDGIADVIKFKMTWISNINKCRSGGMNRP